MDEFELVEVWGDEILMATILDEFEDIGGTDSGRSGYGCYKEVYFVGDYVLKRFKEAEQLVGELVAWNEMRGEVQCASILAAGYTHDRDGEDVGWMVQKRLTDTLEGYRLRDDSLYRVAMDGEEFMCDHNWVSDMHSENIMLDEDEGRWYVIDFGGHCSDDEWEFETLRKAA